MRRSSSRSSGGMSIRTDRPMASSAVYPNICFAPAFQLRMTLSRVFPTIASSDDSTIAASHSDGLVSRCMAMNYVVRAILALRPTYGEMAAQGISGFEIVLDAPLDHLVH